MSEMKDLVITERQKLVAVADAIRSRTGGTAGMSLDDMPIVVGGIVGGGIDTSDATATADKIFLNETAYVKGGKVTGTFTIDEELDEQNNLLTQLETILANKSIAGDLTITITSSGLITASIGSISTTRQITSQDDGNLIPENIKSGVNIFGVTGSYTGGNDDNEEDEIPLQ